MNFHADHRKFQNGKIMNLDLSKRDVSDTQKFEKRVQHFACQALALLKAKGMTPRESLRAILVDSEPMAEFGQISWMVAEQLLFLELIRRHRAKRFIHRVKYDGQYGPDGSWT